MQIQRYRLVVDPPFAALPSSIDRNCASENVPAAKGRLRIGRLGGVFRMVYTDPITGFVDLSLARSILSPGELRSALYSLRGIRPAKTPACFDNFFSLHQP